MLENLAHFWRLTRELDVSALRTAVERPISLHVLGSEGHLASRLADLIQPGSSYAAGAGRDDGVVRVGTLGEWADAGRGRVAADVYVVAIGHSLDADARRALSEISRGEHPLLLVQPAGPSPVVVVGVPEEHILVLPESPGQDGQDRDRLAAALVRVAPDAALPLGRRCPPLREAVAESLIRDASRANAQFAALSNLPAMLPLVGGVVGDVADVLVLTKNQVLMLLKLAGLYGRDLRLGRRLLLEILPVVGGAFFWRTTARALVGLLPPVLGVLPKTVVAYTGTYIVGAMARYYYQYGKAPPPQVMARLRADALRLGRASLTRLTRQERAG